MLNWLSNICNLILFSLFHAVNFLIYHPIATLIQILYAFIFAIIFEKTGSLWVVIIIHYLIDAVGFGVMIDNQIFEKAPLEKYILGEVGWIIAGLLLLISTLPNYLDLGKLKQIRRN